MSDIAIKFHHISKQYRLGLITTGTISHDLNRWWQTAILRREDPYLRVGEVNDRAKKGKSDYVWALRDIDFEVPQGEVLGIVGKNGSGKSTLLKILSRITAPTIGTIEVEGRIASLLEVGTGFHPELTGLENIYMNGAILGMTKKEINQKLDEIVDFSGIERYLDTPVKRYSSGMIVRLGFSIAAYLEPDILVVDEVLAVGDAEFQKKAIGKMQDVSRNDGRTVLFVSHNMEAISSLCNSCVLLVNGELKDKGTTNDIIGQYLGTKQYGSEVTLMVKNTSYPYFKEIKISTSAEPNIQYFGYPLTITMQLFFPQKINACELSFQVREATQDAPVSYNGYSTVNELKQLVNREGLCTVTITIPSVRLYKGKYYFRFNLRDPRGKVGFHEVNDFFPFEVRTNDFILSHGAYKYVESTICQVT